MILSMIDEFRCDSRNGSFADPQIESVLKYFTSLAMK